MGAAQISSLFQQFAFFDDGFEFVGVKRVKLLGDAFKFVVVARHSTAPVTAAVVSNDPSQSLI